ncbi:hypothetical protein HMPREF0542_11790 [Ligilactobacillus ruminis ATCC 25644]|uniref:Uncharacterized protein n=1 Tax=Ligilactobacillus ruminis ATCC 25644 TaxID=525362 RepID=E7FSB3_9LACO|nr:hypothetical protein HMPREF0542_11790 [Ligilactobacillus ruminis ATCC 25644]
MRFSPLTDSALNRGNLDVGVSDAKEFKSVVHEHFKAFFRK